MTEEPETPSEWAALVERCRKKFGSTDERTLEVTRWLAKAYYRAGDEESEKATEVALLEAARRHLGDRHPVTLNTMPQLAMSYARIGELEKARALQTEVLAYTEERYGPGHRRVVHDLGNLEHMI